MVEYTEPRGASSPSECLLGKSDQSSENAASTKGGREKGRESNFSAAINYKHSETLKDRWLCT